MNIYIQHLSWRRELDLLVGELLEKGEIHLVLDVEVSVIVRRAHEINDTEIERRISILAKDR